MSCQEPSRFILQGHRILEGIRSCFSLPIRQDTRETSIRTWCLPGWGSCCNLQIVRLQRMWSGCPAPECMRYWLEFWPYPWPLGVLLSWRRCFVLAHGRMPTLLPPTIWGMSLLLQVLYTPLVQWLLRRSWFILHKRISMGWFSHLSR